MQELLRHFPDGSRDYGDGVIGPSSADIEYFNSLPTKEVLIGRVEAKPDSNWRSKLFGMVLDHMPKSKRLRRFAAPLALSASAAVYGGAVCNSESTPKASELQPRLTYSLTLPSAAGEDWWYVGGPHSDGLSGGVRYAVDFSPSPAAISCKDGEPHVYTEKFVRTIADGVVVHVGNENDSTDKYHSIVEIDHGNGFVGGDMHLSDIQVKVGQKVKQGDPLGYASCEVPPGGETDGVHDHKYAYLNGKPIEIDRLVMSGWEIQGTSGNYQGTMIKSGEDVRKADTRRCGPSAASIKACGGIRNDIKWGALAELAPTIAPKPTIAPVPTLEKLVIPTVKAASSDKEMKRQEIEAKMEKAQQLTQQFIDLLKAGGEANIQAAFNMQLPESQKNRLNSYSLAPLDTLRICSDEMIKGEIQDIRLSRWVIPDPNKVQTEADKLNRARGLVPRDVYSYGVTFLFNDWNSAAGARIGFREYGLPNDDMLIGFEDVNGQLLITQSKLCTTIGGPLAKTSYQYGSGQ